MARFANLLRQPDTSIHGVPCIEKCARTLRSQDGRKIRRQDKNKELQGA